MPIAPFRIAKDGHDAPAVEGAARATWVGTAAGELGVAAGETATDEGVRRAAAGLDVPSGERRVRQAGQHGLTSVAASVTAPAEVAERYAVGDEPARDAIRRAITDASERALQSEGAEIAGVTVVRHDDAGLTATTYVFGIRHNDRLASPERSRGGKAALPRDVDAAFAAALPQALREHAPPKRAPELERAAPPPAPQRPAP